MTINLKNKELVSVVVPVYNIEDYVENCIKSILKQTYNKMEILLIDDGSTDRSGEICDRFQRSDKRIKVFHHVNAGLSEARNLGIRMARGEFIVLIDGDDFVDEKYVELMHSEMIRTRADVVVCGYDNERPAKQILSGEDATIKLLTLQGNLDVVAWNKMYRKKLFEDYDIWYPKGLKHEDAMTTYKLFSKAKKVAYLDVSLYHYVVRSSSIMGQAKVIDQLNMRERAARESVEYLKGTGKMERAAKIAVLTAKFAYIDAVIARKIQWKYYGEKRRWILEHAGEYEGNEFLSKKLRIYLVAIRIFGGLGYKIFRKIK